ncbi:hypothetical protein DR950_33545 [Kitasatospora xanthocidica]|uniref:Uncharacterized protein n=2 Tax=Kitasatospora TaxID=2063 RepID=A0A373A1S3_9ACTN|nr:hypothetical protein [Kitasatospora xanthocidica]RGD62011.1 hypothetical protein DR950_33545 [Kitasatospora xanthocidica]
MRDFPAVTLRLRRKNRLWDEARHARDLQGRFAHHPGAGRVGLPGTLADDHAVSQGDLLGKRGRSPAKLKAAMCDSLAKKMSGVPDEQLLSDRQRDRLARVRAGDLAAYRPESGANGYADHIDQADLDSGARREPWGYVRMGAEEYRDFARAEAVSHHVAGWAATSNDHDANALALQETARQAFNLTDTMAWEHGDADLDAETAQALAEDGPVLHAFLTAMWESTQAHFADLGVTHVTVHRGFTGGYDDTHVSEIDGQGTVTDLPLRPLSSFTTEEHVAADFATHGGEVHVGYTISGDVPVTRILAVPGTGIGCLDESEIVILAGPGDWHVQQVYAETDDDNWYDG